MPKSFKYVFIDNILVSSDNPNIIRIDHLLSKRFLSLIYFIAYKFIIAGPLSSNDPRPNNLSFSIIGLNASDIHCSLSPSGTTSK